MTSDEPRPPMLGDDRDQPLDPAVLGPWQGEPDDGGQPPPGRRVRPLWFAAAAAAVVLVGGAVGIVAFNSAAPRPARGAATASDAATRFVRAVDAGDGSAAAAISCHAFAAQARSTARSGGQGFRFAVLRVRAAGATDALAAVRQRVVLPGSTVQTQTITLELHRAGGRWLVCGHS